MTFSEQDFSKIVHLSHLELSPETKERMYSQLQDVLEYMHFLKQAPSFSSTDIRIDEPVVLREDSAETFPIESIFEQAPEVEDHCFVVPQILSTDEGQA